MKTKNTKNPNVRWLCPLLAFNCAPEIIDLDYRPEIVELAEAIQVKRVPIEFSDYLNINYPDSPDLFSAEYMVELSLPAVSYDKIATMTELTFKASNLLFDLITAFRLCHGGTIAPGPLLYNNKDSDSYAHGWSRVPLLFIEFLPPISKKEVDFTSFEPFEYEFSSSDVPMVNKLLSEISNYRKSGQFAALDEPLRRFNSAYHGEFEDRLIDQMIAFESLYIGDDKELGYKLALRTAFLLAKDEDERKVILNGVKEAYKLRGQIVHGSKKVDISKLEETIPKTEEYLRQSIRKFLKLLASGYSLDNLKKGKDKKSAILDENVLKNGTLLA